MMTGHYGIVGLLILILDIWAMVSTINSGGDTGSKVLWIVLILLLPVVGFIAWFLVGPKGN